MPASALSTTQQAEEEQRRRPWQRAFTPAAIKEYEAQLSKRTSQLVARLEAQQGEVRLDQWFDYFTCVADTLYARGGADRRLLQIRLHVGDGVSTSRPSGADGEPDISLPIWTSCPVVL